MYQTGCREKVAAEGVGGYGQYMEQPERGGRMGNKWNVNMHLTCVCDVCGVGGDCGAVTRMP